jgi:hypothetical protein
MDLGEKGGGGMDWIDLAQGSCENCNKYSVSIKFWENLEQLSNWQLLNKDSPLRS